MNTEDKFYFGKHGQPERFENAPWMSGVNRMLRDLSKERAKIQIWISGSDSVTTAGSSIGKNVRYMGTTWLVAGRIANYLKDSVPGAASQHTVQDDYPKKNMTTSFYKVSNLPKELIAYLKNWGIGTSPKAFSGFTGDSAVAYSRPGQPERFAREVIARKGNKRVELSGPMADGRWTVTVMEENKQVVPGEVNERFVESKFYSTEAGARRAASKMLASRPGQPERFDASSLNRGNFAEASSSPMLGKLLSEKQMPEGGWRAVETGGGALVISFEDGDVAGNFARRVAGSGYSATAPVQSIGRYWNVEVKNGK